MAERHEIMAKLKLDIEVSQATVGRYMVLAA